MKEVKYILEENEIEEILLKLSFIEEQVNKIVKDNNLGDDIGYNEDAGEIIWTVNLLKRYFE